MLVSEVKMPAGDRDITFPNRLSAGMVVIERHDNGAVKRRIPVTKVERGGMGGPCVRTKTHVNDDLCFDNATPIEIEDMA